MKVISCHFVSENRVEVQNANTLLTALLIYIFVYFSVNNNHNNNYIYGIVISRTLKFKVLLIIIKYSIYNTTIVAIKKCDLYAISRYC